MACGEKKEAIEAPSAGPDAGNVVSVPEGVAVPEAPKPLEGGLAQVSAPEKPTTPDFAELDPVLAGVGPQGTVPQKLEIRFPFSVLTGRKKEHEIEITPALEGQWRRRSPQVLQFRGEALAPSTTYKVAIKKLQTRYGDVEG